MRLFFTAALIGSGAFHAAFGQNTCETFTDSESFSNSGMATGPTKSLTNFTASGTMTFSNTNVSSSSGNSLGQCGNGSPPPFKQTSTGQTNDKGFCNPVIEFFNDPIDQMVQNAQMQVESATINSNGQCSFSAPTFPVDLSMWGGRPRSGRVTGIAPRHPPTPPDVRFSASGG